MVAAYYKDRRAGLWAASTVPQGKHEDLDSDSQVHLERQVWMHTSLILALEVGRGSRWP